MPTHKDKPNGFEDVAARRSAELEAAAERARLERQASYADALRERDVRRQRTSVPPPRQS